MIKNKISIYLVKKNVTNINDVIKGSIKQKRIQNVGICYYKPLKEKEPSWVKSFYKNEIDDLNFKSLMPGSVLVISKIINNEKRIFLIAHGYGRNFINMDSVVKDFGLKITLNSINFDGLKKISKKDIAHNQKISNEQLPQTSDISEFSVDFYRQLISNITGVSSIKDISEGIISGNIAFSTSSHVDVYSIKNYVEKLYKQYISEEYKKYFSWIDYINTIKDKPLINELNQHLLDLCNNNPNEVKLAIPEYIEWEEIEGFKYNKIIYDDISKIHISSILTNKQNSIEFLKKQKIYAINSNLNDKNSKYWYVYKCIYVELSHKSKNYCLNNGSWFCINEDYTREINEIYNSIKISDISFLEYAEKKEEEYNKKYTDVNKEFLNMDQKFVYYGGNRSKFEVCDILSPNKKLVHVKKYSGSATLSHLCNQGINSLQLIRTSPEFIKDANKIIDNISKEKNIDKNKYLLNKNDNFTVVYAIIKSEKGERPNQCH